MIPGLQLPGQANMVQMPNIMMQNMMPNMQPGMQQMRPGMVQPGQPIFPGQPGYENHNFWQEIIIFQNASNNANATRATNDDSTWSTISATWCPVSTNANVSTSSS